MKELINKNKEYIKNIGKTLCTEKYNDGTEFYCLLDRYGNFNIADTGRSLDEIKTRIKFWESLISKGVIRIM